jgi:hypothetical protein
MTLDHHQPEAAFPPRGGHAALAESLTSTTQLFMQQPVHLSLLGIWRMHNTQERTDIHQGYVQGAEVAVTSGGRHERCR